MAGPAPGPATDAARPLPTSFEQLITSFRHQIRFYLRTWRFVGLALFVLAISMIGVALDIYNGADAVRAGSPTSSLFLAGALGFITLAIPIAAAFFGGDAISMDFGSSTGYFSLVQPVHRPVLLGGRYLAACAATFLVGGINYALAVGEAAVVYGNVPWGDLGLSLGLYTLFILGVVAFAFFFSALIRRPVVSMILTVILFILGFPIIQGSLALTDIEPIFFANYAGQAVYEVFHPLPHVSTLATPIGNGRTLTIYTFHPIIWEAAVVLFLYTVAFFLVSTLHYHRKELVG